MAAPKARPDKRQGGGTILGFLVGLVFGLIIAVVVAIFVTRAPVPFVNRLTKGPDRVTDVKPGAETPDPNRPLYGKNRQSADGGAAPPPTGPIASMSPPPASPALPPGGASAVPTPAPADVIPGPGRVADADREDKTMFVLQAGAFRSQDDAEGMKARLALIGYEARVLNSEVNGQTLYRVRVGPFAQIEEINRVRAKLAQSGIEASVVRQR
ncbi:MAG: SPOR domain-containing protein [Burkholderiaceae bacterium]